MTDNHPNRRIDDKRDTQPLQWIDQPDALHPDYQKALRTRDDLEDHIARCGAQLLDMLGVGGFLAPITGTNPVQYVAAGTLDMIGNVMQYAPGSPVSTAVGEPVLSNEQIAQLNREAQDQSISGELPSVYLARAVEREVVARLAAPTQVSAPQADEASMAEIVQFVRDVANSGKEMNGSYWIPRAAVLLQIFDATKAASAQSEQASAAQEVRAVPGRALDNSAGQSRWRSTYFRVTARLHASKLPAR